ncbi:RsmF rRNA methyltransferase first C-terminal domain-containing protein [Streptococcus halichoeri]|uniref:RsmF rRNA methyltransferase first C-terminal domain-containing protein n=1 Tax=Streptococcus halichoeri TaxID=254785 RepID=UPI00135CE2C1|nr:RsmB/NOP family class I SAM-dependent RNA methyltransferase [Streptococcus halichoeri]
MNLPTDFMNKYKAILGSEAEVFFSSFDENAVSAFRVNPLKPVVKTYENPIPKTPWGYYGKILGRSIDHVTGLVYSQEPAAQMVGQVAQPSPGMKVLDLAAAPGGKSTHLLAYLNNTGLLVSNDISKKRSQTLVENIERFGARNVIVTNESAQRLANVFPDYFDMIVLDAPCSGEGMFRKDPAAMAYWHPNYPKECAELQKEILQDALKMLKPGGVLVYSTCTWSPEENEEVVQWLLDDYPLELEELPLLNGMTPGLGLSKVARMYPHHFVGEGQFVARLRDTRPIGKEPRRKSPKSNLTQEQKQLWHAFAKHHLATSLDGILQTFGDHLYLLPNDLPDLRGIRIARNGLELGTFKKKRFEPSFALGLALGPKDVNLSLAIDEEAFRKYVAGHTLKLGQTLPTDWYLVTVQGLGIGFSKVVGDTLKNSFPKGLRF